TFDANSLAAALDLARHMLSRFVDPRGGGFFSTSIDHEKVVAGVKDSQDNAVPSGNGMAAHALARLGAITGQVNLLGKAYATLEAMSGQLEKFAMASGQALLALDFVLGPSHEVVIVDGGGSSVDDSRREPHSPRASLAESALGESGRHSGDSVEGNVALRELFRRFWPNKVVALRSHDLSDDRCSMSLRDL